MSHQPFGATPTRNDANRENRETGHEYATAAEDVPETSTQQEKPAEHQGVGVLDPGQPGCRVTHAALDAG